MYLSLAVEGQPPAAIIRRLYEVSWSQTAMISRWEHGSTEIPSIRGSGATGAGLISTTLRHPALSIVPTAAN